MFKKDTVRDCLRHEECQRLIKDILNDKSYTRCPFQTFGLYKNDFKKLNAYALKCAKDVSEVITDVESMKNLSVFIDMLLEDVSELPLFDNCSDEEFINDILTLLWIGYAKVCLNAVEREWECEQLLGAVSFSGVHAQVTWDLYAKHMHDILDMCYYKEKEGLWLVNLKRLIVFMCLQNF